VERTLVALKRFAAVARARNVVKVHARGTCALREAEDRGPFLDRIRQETGMEVQVLTGAEEARLIGKGVLSGLSDVSGEVVLVDVGGGSVEVSRAVEGTLTDVASLKLGAVRLSEVFLRSDPPAAAEMDLLRQHARILLKSVVTFNAGNARVVGSAGTLNALWQLSGNGKANNPRLRVEDLEATVTQLSRMTLARRRQVAGLEAKRADIIVAGGLAVLEVLKHVGAREVEVTRRGLKEGLLLDAVESLGVALPNATEPERVRVEGAMMVARRYFADEAHASQVAALACSLFEGLRAVHGLGEDARSELEAAALLHDIGQYISFDKHHRHGAYLVSHSTLPGFSDSARARLAAMVRYHRKRGPQARDPEWLDFSKADRARVVTLSALLRVADALDRGHHHVVKDVSVEVSKKQVNIRLLTSAPADVEAWAVAEKADLFRKVFKRELNITVAEATAKAEPTRGRKRA
jgi:exopolyphosphatase/guanosine-5'-triphosphate,3'-diphosphate pyrophosphatase